MSERLLDAARQMVRYALEDAPCWPELYRIVDEERDRLWPQYSEELVRGRPRRLRTRRWKDLRREAA